MKPSSKLDQRSDSAADGYCAGILLVDTGDQLKEGGLTRAVPSDKPYGCSAWYSQGEIFDCAGYRGATISITRPPLKCPKNGTLKSRIALTNTCSALKALRNTDDVNDVARGLANCLTHLWRIRYVLHVAIGPSL
jgi:hypothetical protein